MRLENYGVDKKVKFEDIYSYYREHVLPTGLPCLVRRGWNFSIPPPITFIGYHVPTLTQYTLGQPSKLSKCHKAQSHSDPT